MPYKVVVLPRSQWSTSFSKTNADTETPWEWAFLAPWDLIIQPNG